jgi:hypothetical protein
MYKNIRGKNYCTSRFYNQINFFITLINGGDFDKCGGDIDGGDFAVGQFAKKSLFSERKRAITQER